jgi:hypothetical protein
VRGGSGDMSGRRPASAETTFPSNPRHDHADEQPRTEQLHRPGPEEPRQCRTSERFPAHGPSQRDRTENDSGDQNTYDRPEERRWHPRQKRIDEKVELRYAERGQGKYRRTLQSLRCVRRSDRLEHRSVSLRGVWTLQLSKVRNAV